MFLCPLYHVVFVDLGRHDCHGKTDSREKQDIYLQRGRKEWATPGAQKLVVAQSSVGNLSCWSGANFQCKCGHNVCSIQRIDAHHKMSCIPIDISGVDESDVMVMKKRKRKAFTSGKPQ